MTEQSFNSIPILNSYKVKSDNLDLFAITHNFVYNDNKPHFGHFTRNNI